MASGFQPQTVFNSIKLNATTVMLWLVKQDPVFLQLLAITKACVLSIGISDSGQNCLMYSFLQFILYGSKALCHGASLQVMMALKRGSVGLHNIPCVPLKRENGIMDHICDKKKRNYSAFVTRWKEKGKKKSQRSSVLFGLLA